MTARESIDRRGRTILLLDDVYSDCGRIGTSSVVRLCMMCCCRWKNGVWKPTGSFSPFVSFLIANAARGGGTDDVACRGAIIAERHLTSGDVIT